MDVEILPRPTEEELRAILDAVRESETPPSPYRSRWRLSALDDLRDGALAEEAGGDAGIVEP